MSGGGQPTSATAALLRPPRRPVVVRTKIGAGPILLKFLIRDRDARRRVADREGHDERYSLDSTKIKERLGFEPAVSLAQGLAETVRWYRENRWWWQQHDKAMTYGGTAS